MSQLQPSSPCRPRPRVLLIAEACNPSWVSVPLVGYNLSKAIAAEADVQLVTQIRNRDALAANGDDVDRIAFIDSELLARPFHLAARALTLGRGVGWTTRQALNWLPYIYFERLVYRRFGEELRRGEFDIIHRVTPLSPTYPSPLAKWCDVPLVLGPLNGGLPWPPGTAKTRLAEMEFLSYVRDAYRVLPYVRATYRRAACVIAGSTHTRAQLPQGALDRTVYMPENGIDPQRFNAEGRPRPSELSPLRVLFVGRLVPYKGCDLVLEALGGSALLAERTEFVIVGDGPQRPSLEARARDFKDRLRVRFLGRLPQAEVAEHFRQASVFAFPSLREFGGGVVLEALACGLPCVIVDYGGPRELLAPNCGAGIPVADRQGMIRSLRSELERLVAAPELLDACSASATQHVQEHHLWSRKGERIRAVYDAVLAGRTDLPTLGLPLPSVQSC